MSGSGEQLSFEMPRQEALGGGDFFLSEANYLAHEQVLFQDWERLVLVGPAGGGKSHLARIWADERGRILNAAELGSGTVMPDAQDVVIEDADRLPHYAEEWLFHLHNRLHASGGRLLLTARSAPASWDLRLPDLQSRLQAIPVVQINDPDDILLEALLLKLFSDRQLRPEPDLAPYLAKRIERSFDAAQQIVADLDRAALASGRNLTRALAVDLLSRPPG